VSCCLLSCGSAINYMVLGNSIPNILEIGSGSSLDYLRAFHTLMQEYDHYSSHGGANSKPSKMVIHPRSPSSKRDVDKLEALV
jgi:hypothetical protein